MLRFSEEGLLVTEMALSNCIFTLLQLDIMSNNPFSASCDFQETGGAQILFEHLSMRQEQTAGWGSVQMELDYHTKTNSSTKRQIQNTKNTEMLSITREQRVD